MLHVASFRHVGSDMAGEILDGVFSIEKCGSFFERTSLGFGGPEPDEGEFEHEPARVDKVVLPLEGIQGDGVGILIEDDSSHDGEVHHGKTLGTDEEWKNFDGVGHEQWSVGNGVEGVEDEDEGEECSSRANVSGLLVGGRHSGDDRVGYKHTTSGDNEEWTTTGSLDVQGSGNGNDDWKFIRSAIRNISRR